MRGLWLRCAVLGSVLALLSVTAVPAQGALGEPEGPVSLVADSVSYDTATGVLTAEGAVEVFYGNRTLTAERIVYDSEADRISADGALVLRDPDTGSTVFADAAELDPELRDGLVEGARLVIGEHVKLAAVEARRVDDRYNALSKAVYSPCRVCEASPTPLWRIRARRVIHDEKEKVIHYENATFDLFGVPVLWAPYFRHADPTVDRKSGVLTPELLNSTTFGYGLKVPYYYVINDNADVTVTPFLTSDDGPILIGEYRHRFTFGDLHLEGSATVDDYEDGDNTFHGHLDALGEFETRGGIDYGFDIEVVSDDPYLKRYEFSDEDRLESEIFVRDYGRNGFFDVAGLFFQSLRDDEPSGEIPFVLPDIAVRQTFADPFAGGEFGLFTDVQALVRTDGDDNARLTLGGDWERQWITDFGLALTAFGEARVDLWASGQDAIFSDDGGARLAPLAGVEARFPLVAEQAGGATHILEPIAQAIVAPYGGNADIPNEDSQLTEFDETSLFERNHFAGLDGFEEGPRFNLGLRYERISDDGFDFDASAGRVFRFREADEFSVGSGLTDRESDWVGAWALSLDPWFSVRQRVRLAGDLSLTRNEIYGGLDIDPVEFDVAYIFLDEDPRIDVPSDREEIQAAARVQLTDRWSIGGFAQRDIGREEWVETGGLIGYRTECIELDLKLERTFTDREDAPAATSVGLELRLLTLGTDVGDGDARGGRCTPQWGS